MTLISASYMWISRLTVVSFVGSSGGAAGEGGVTGAGGAAERVKNDEERNDVNPLAGLVSVRMGTGRGVGVKPVAAACQYESWLSAYLRATS